MTYWKDDPQGDERFTAVLQRIDAVIAVAVLL